MIGKLRGFIDSLHEDRLILDVQGVGYTVFIPKSKLLEFSPGEEENTFFIETIVKEDSLTLYGFQSLIEQEWFRVLMTVQGVGARLALGILSHFSPDVLYGLIAGEDKKTLTTAEGVGQKLAVRLITELKEKILRRPELQGSHREVAFVSVSPKNKSVSFIASSSKEKEDVQLKEDVLSALENLGYKRAEAFPIVQELLQNKEESIVCDIPSLLRQALQRLSRSTERVRV